MSGTKLSITLLLSAIMALPATVSAGRHMHGPTGKKGEGSRPRSDHRSGPKLILIRHGQSRYNLQNRFTGRADVPLTRKGRAQARKAGRQIKDIPCDVTYTSSLRRARHTLGLILGRSGRQTPVIRTQALDERDYGRLQGLDKAETARRFGKEQVHIWRRSYNVAPPGGESLKQTARRTLGFFDSTIARDLRQGKTVLVVAHENTLRTMMMKLDNISPKEISQLKLSNGVPIIYQFERDGSVLGRQGLR